MYILHVHIANRNNTEKSSRLPTPVALTPGKELTVLVACESTWVGEPVVKRS
jgi:hypothetical protein